MFSIKNTPLSRQRKFSLTRRRVSEVLEETPAANPPEGYELYFSDITPPIADNPTAGLTANHQDTLINDGTYDLVQISIEGNEPAGYVFSGEQQVNGINDYVDQPDIYIFADDGTEFTFTPDETYTDNFTGVYHDSAGSVNVDNPHFSIGIWWALESTDPKIAEFEALAQKITAGEITSISVWIGFNGATNIS